MLKQAGRYCKYPVYDNVSFFVPQLDPPKIGELASMDDLENKMTS